VAQRLATNLRTAAIPIIFLTARNSPEDMGKAAAEGAMAYLTKPFKPEDLLSAVERALGSSRAAG
jgi:CheY-like chemotaxis protein